MMTEERRQTNAAKTEQAKRRAAEQGDAYLDHGVPSLVAMDNPDDSQLGAPGDTGEGSPI